MDTTSSTSAYKVTWVFVLKVIASRNGDWWSCGGKCGQCFELPVYKGERPSLLSPSHTFGPCFDMPVATLDNTTPDGYTTVHGYYRFTDIFYEWYVFQRKKLAYASETS